LGNYSKKWQ